MAEPWLDSAQTGGTGWVQPGKAQPYPICSLGWGFIHAWVSPGWVLLLARFWSLWGITCICIPHSLSCISSLSPTLGAEVGGAQPRLSMAVCPGMGMGRLPAGISGQGAVGAWCLCPCHPHPRLPMFCQSQRLAKRAWPSQHWCLPSGEPRKPRASTTTALPGPPTGDTGGAGQGRGGCWGSLRLVPCW